MSSRSTGVAILLMVACVTLTVLPSQAQESAGADAENLAKQLSNPIADLVSIPFQFNWENGGS